VRGHGRYPETGADLKADATGKSHNPVSGQVRVLLRSARRPLVACEIHPDSIAYGKIYDSLPNGIDNTGAV
jgi:hypothetical protein